MPIALLAPFSLFCSFLSFFYLHNKKKRGEETGKYEYPSCSFLFFLLSLFFFVSVFFNFKNEGRNYICLFFQKYPGGCVSFVAYTLHGGIGIHETPESPTQQTNINYAKKKTQKERKQEKKIKKREREENEDGAILE
jgi:hypothetical protein